MARLKPLWTPSERGVVAGVLFLVKVRTWCSSWWIRPSLLSTWCEGSIATWCHAAGCGLVGGRVRQNRKKVEEEGVQRVYF